jgi:hypothetical protein
MFGGVAKLGVFPRRVSVDQLHDFRYMSNEPINTLYPFRVTSRPDEVTITVVNRLCHMIHRMERSPNPYCGCGARWYCDHIDAAPILASERDYVASLVKRLLTAVEAYEARYYGGEKLFADNFGQLAGSTDQNIAYVLYGPMTTDCNGFPGGSPGTPERKLALYIQEMWRCSIRG